MQCFLPSCQMSEFAELGCGVCKQILKQPVSLSCGHSFCKSCLLRCMNHTSKCPMCDHCVHLDIFTAPVSNVLESIIETG